MTADLTELAFVGHSLGGLVIREGLRHLRFARSRFLAYISLNTPHLGCVSQKFLVSTGRRPRPANGRHQAAVDVFEPTVGQANGAQGLRPLPGEAERGPHDRRVQERLPGVLLRRRLLAGVLVQGDRQRRQRAAEANVQELLEPRQGGSGV